MHVYMCVCVRERGRERGRERERDKNHGMRYCILHYNIHVHVIINHTYIVITARFFYVLNGVRESAPEPCL